MENFYKWLFDLAKKFKGRLAFCAFLILTCLVVVVWVFSKGSFDSLLKPDSFQSFGILCVLILFLCLLIQKILAVAFPNRKPSEPALLYVIVHQSEDETILIPNAEVIVVIDEPMKKETDINGSTNFSLGENLLGKEVLVNARKVGFKNRKPLMVKMLRQKSVRIPLSPNELTAAANKPHNPEIGKSPVVYPVESEFVLEFIVTIEGKEAAFTKLEKFILPQLLHHKWNINRIHQTIFAIKEIVLNGIIHGCKRNTDLHTKVKLEISSDYDSIKALVEDPGDGFDMAAWIKKIEKENPFENSLPSGKGLFLIKRITPKLFSNEKGNCITAIFHRISPSEQLKIQEISENIHYFSFDKEIDMYSLGKIKLHVSKLFNEIAANAIPFSKTILFNFESVEYVDSTGLGYLHTLARLAKELKINIGFCCVPPSVCSLFEVTRSFIAPMYSSQADAIQRILS